MNALHLPIPLFNWENGAFIMTIVFGLVILGLVGIIFWMMNTDKKAK